MVMHSCWAWADQDASLCFDIDAVRACVTYWIAVNVYTKQQNNVNAQ